MEENMTRRFNQSQKGITFIEILIYTALLTITLSLITNFLFQVANFKVNNQIESGLFQNSSLCFNKMSADIRKALAVISPSTSSFSPSLILTTEEGQITYEVSGEAVKRNGVALTDKEVTIELSGPNYGFRKIGNSIQIKMGLTAKTQPFGQPLKKRDYQTTIFLSNF